MTDPGRILAVASDYDGLVDGLRARVAELNTTHNAVDHVGGLQPGYTGKLLGPGAVRAFGRVSLGLILGALGLKIVLVEDKEATARITQRMKVRERDPRMPNRLSMAAKVRQATGKTKRTVLREFYSDIGRKGGKRSAKARMAKMSPDKRREIAQAAARARWDRPRPESTKGAGS